MAAEYTRIVVNADDYGYTRGVSTGIRLAFLAGTLSSATAMMNVPGVVDDIRQARAEVPGMPLGVHLVATFGDPVLPPEQVPSLVGPEGSFHRLADFPDMAARLDQDELRREWSAQIDRLAGLGVAVDHIDSHHHSSYLHPRVGEVMIALAREYDVPVRRPPEPPESHPDVPAQFADAADVRTVDLFVGELMKGSSADKFIDLAQRLPEAVVAEFMVHPAIVDEDLLATSSYAAPRGPELETLRDPRVRTFLVHSRCALTTFGAHAHRRP